MLLPISVATGYLQDHLYSANLLSRGLGEAVLHCPVQIILSAELPPLFLVQVQDITYMQNIFIVEQCGGLGSFFVRFVISTFVAYIYTKKL